MEQEEYDAHVEACALNAKTLAESKPIICEKNAVNHVTIKIVIRQYVRLVQKKLKAKHLKIMKEHPMNSLV